MAIKLYINVKKVDAMPITKMTFENGIAFVREEGRIEKADAKHFAEFIAHHAANHPTPIGCVIDAMNVKFISIDARKIFVRASTIQNFTFSAVAAKDVVSRQTARIIGHMAQDGHTYTFATLDDAWAFAHERLGLAGAGR